MYRILRCKTEFSWFNWIHSCVYFFLRTTGINFMYSSGEWNVPRHEILRAYLWYCLCVHLRACRKDQTCTRLYIRKNLGRDWKTRSQGLECSFAHFSAWYLHSTYSTGRLRVQAAGMKAHASQKSLAPQTVSTVCSIGTGCLYVLSARDEWEWWHSAASTVEYLMTGLLESIEKARNRKLATSCLRFSWRVFLQYLL